MLWSPTPLCDRTTDPAAFKKPYILPIMQKFDASRMWHILHRENGTAVKEK
jgi:hypothetical protein